MTKSRKKPKEYRPTEKGELFSAINVADNARYACYGPFTLTKVHTNSIDATDSRGAERAFDVYGVWEFRAVGI